MPGAYRVLGALGRGPGSPLLAEALVDETVVGQVVLARPAPEAIQASLRRRSSVRIVLERHQVETDRGRWGVLPYVVGSDLVQLRQAREGPVEPVLALAIAAEVVEALGVAAQVGVHHGALDAGSVRVDLDGFVRVLGFRGGEASSDCLAVRDLIEGLCEVDEVPLPTQLAELLQDWPDTLDDLRVRLPDSGLRLADQVTHGNAVLHAHALVGQVLSVRREGGGPPARVRLAAVGALTLVLGLGAGWALAGWGGEPASPDVVVMGAAEIELDCDPQVFGGERLPLDTARTCRVTARMADGSQLVGDLDGPPMGRYLCVREEGGLRCAER